MKDDEELHNNEKYDVLKRYMSSAISKPRVSVPPLPKRLSRTGSMRLGENHLTLSQKAFQEFLDRDGGTRTELNLQELTQVVLCLNGNLVVSNLFPFYYNGSYGNVSVARLSLLVKIW
eukprot:TRINITY_DN6210_c0_g1_i7.p1 TRINITY_DN6210_c0_g1~~TRINITY_DN6210_c0_g1_i7.p1  ORF type:complete len:134 (-),score=27.93 TRINITY_DN6210_c0_g1_i7:832-1185(-)